MRILGYLDAISLGRAAQVSKSWKSLADDDLLWRRMCGQHIDRKCEKCGWGLPLLERKRLKVELKDRSPAAAVGVGGHEHGHGTSRVMTRVEALGGKAPDLGIKGGKEGIGQKDLGMRSGNTAVGLRVCDSVVPVVNPSMKKRLAPNLPVKDGHNRKRAKVEGSDSESDVSSTGSLVRDIRLTRPWKSVYCERLVVERNWRKGRYNTKTLKVSF